MKEFGLGFPNEIIPEKYNVLSINNVLISPYQSFGDEYKLTKIEDLSKIIYYYKRNETDKSIEWYSKKYQEFLNEIDILIEKNNLRKNL